MKRYIKDLSHQEMVELIGHNNYFACKLDEAATANADMWINEYLFGIRENGGADYCIGAGYRGSFFRIQDDGNTYGMYPTYHKFRDWFESDGISEDMPLSDCDRETVETFLRYAKLLEDLNSAPMDSQYEQHIFTLHEQYKEAANAALLARLMSEYDYGVESLIDQVEWVFDSMDDYENAYVTDDWKICIDVPEVVIPAHREEIF